jgi:hypothetical protein
MKSKCQNTCSNSFLCGLPQLIDSIILMLECPCKECLIHITCSQACPSRLNYPTNIRLRSFKNKMVFK